jgi:hypothetical protein
MLAKTMKDEPTPKRNGASKNPANIEQAAAIRPQIPKIRVAFIGSPFLEIESGLNSSSYV